MILVTGGAGFIGSNIHAALVARGEATVVADRLGHDGRWRNLRAHPPGAIVAPEDLKKFLASAYDLRAIIHMGAISDTTATDGDLVWETNVGNFHASMGSLHRAAHPSAICVVGRNLR